ncbi:uncharacterized protein LOC134470644 isoform X2 [Cavia porcellus]|uniref:uncharacterized protein LOC134470644 isoform X2 n=1 Tax=Cavia porcellus TaxID=10141 RepID=UPI002FE12679
MPRGGGAPAAGIPAVQRKWQEAPRRRWRNNKKTRNPRKNGPGNRHFSSLFGSGSGVPGANSFPAPSAAPSLEHGPAPAELLSPGNPRGPPLSRADSLDTPRATLSVTAPSSSSEAFRATRVLPKPSGATEPAPGYSVPGRPGICILMLGPRPAGKCWAWDISWLSRLDCRPTDGF